MKKLLIFTLILSSLICVSGCGDIYRYFFSGEISKAIRKEIVDKHSKRINIAQLTHFEWDNFFIFGAYEPLNELCDVLERYHVDRLYCEAEIGRYSLMDDGKRLLVFLNKGNIVYTEMPTGYYGQFDAEYHPFNPKNAIFDVVIDKKSTYHDGSSVTDLKPIIK